MDPDRVFKVLIRICEKKKQDPSGSKTLPHHITPFKANFCFLGNVVEDTDDTAEGLG